MRLLLIFEEVPFFMPGYLRRFLKRRRAEVIGLTPSFTNKANPKRAKKGKTFFSYARRHPFRFGVKALFIFGSLTAYYQLTNKLLSLLGLNSPYSVRGVAKSQGIPIIETVSVNDEEYLRKLSQMDIDIIISTNGQIFKKGILSIPKLRCLNVHTSILPGYGGCYPPLFYLLNNEPMYGVSCHTMEEKIDKGTIVAQKRFPIEANDTVTSLYTKAYNLASEVLDEGITNFVNGVEYPDVSDVKPSYYTFPTKEHFDKLFAMGKRFI